MREIELMPGEHVVDKERATIGERPRVRSGDLILTTRRLVWLAHSSQLPPTGWTGTPDIILPLDEITVQAVGDLLNVGRKGSSFDFRVYRRSWLGFRRHPLAEQWAKAIAVAKQNLIGATP